MGTLKPIGFWIARIARTRGLPTPPFFPLQRGRSRGGRQWPWERPPAAPRNATAKASRWSAFLWLAAACLLAPAHAADIPAPAAHLGYQAGADFHLAPWAVVAEYFRKVDAASDRVAVRELGKTTEGRPYLMAIISSPETIRDRKTYQDLQHRLSDPRVAGQATRSAQSKAVVVITCSIHSIETASTFMAMELLHELATRDDPATREVLDKTILLLVPSANPDGVDKVAPGTSGRRGIRGKARGCPSSTTSTPGTTPTATGSCSTLRRPGC